MTMTRSPALKLSATVVAETPPAVKTIFFVASMYTADMVSQTNRLRFEPTRLEESKEKLNESATQKSSPEGMPSLDPLYRRSAVTSVRSKPTSCPQATSVWTVGEMATVLSV